MKEDDSPVRRPKNKSMNVQSRYNRHNEVHTQSNSISLADSQPLYKPKLATDGSVVKIDPSIFGVTQTDSVYLAQTKGKARMHY